MTAGALLAGAALCAARVRERPQVHTALSGAGLLAVLPWLAPQFVLPGVPVAVALVRWTARRGRRVVALGAAEVTLASLVFYLSLNDRLYGGLTPWSGSGGVEGAIGTDLPFGPLERVPRFAAVLVGPDAGIVRWAPILALAPARRRGCSSARDARGSGGWSPSGARPSTSPRSAWRCSPCNSRSRRWLRPPSPGRGSLGASSHPARRRGAARRMGSAAHATGRSGARSAHRSGKRVGADRVVTPMLLGVSSCAFPHRVGWSNTTGGMKELMRPQTCRVSRPGHDAAQRHG